MKESEYRELCLQQWKLVYTKGISKANALWRMDTDITPWEECFACEYVKDNFPRRGAHDALDCHECPIKWSDNSSNSSNSYCQEYSQSPYRQYEIASTPRELKLTGYEVYQRILTTWKPKE